MSDAVTVNAAGLRRFSDQDSPLQMVGWIFSALVLNF
jgi:hypothetical protein